MQLKILEIKEPSANLRTYNKRKSSNDHNKHSFGARNKVLAIMEQRRLWFAILVCQRVQNMAFGPSKKESKRENKA